MILTDDELQTILISIRNEQRTAKSLRAAKLSVLADKMLKEMGQRVADQMLLEQLAS